jgi:type I restriction enzyme, S subunit
VSALTDERPRLGFAVGRAGLSARADVNYFQLAPRVEELRKRSRFPLVELGSIASDIKYGDSSKSIEEDNGAPILRMNNLHDGDWDLRELKYTDLDAESRGKFQLIPGDLLFNRTNSKELVGKCSVFRESGDWFFAGYLIRVRVDDPQDYAPEFLARFLNSDVGRVQIDRVSRQIIGMANVNTTEIRGLLVPKPPRPVQDEMVEELSTHWARRQEALETVDELLTAGNREIAERLDLDAPQVGKTLAFAATRAQMSDGGRLNPDFFHPERMESISAIRESGNAAVPLEEMATFVRDTVSAPGPGDFYLGLANVEPHTGELLVNPEEELPDGDCVAFKKGDVLYSKLRPYLNKVHLAEREGVASPEFFVLRPNEEVRAAYLAAILRAPIVLAQTRHMTSGNTHPRLTTQDVHSMYLPKPDTTYQDAVAAADDEARLEARAIKLKAEAEWADAKQRFGDNLID